MEDWKKAALEHALEEAPRESVGFIVGGEYVRGENIHDDPENFFSTTPPDEGEFDAVVHSHPNGNHYPSKDDMAAQLALGKPFYIVAIDHVNGHEIFGFGDQLPMPELLGRPFRHGVTDCYSLARDYYRTKGVNLPEVPRQFGWWAGDNPEELYFDNFEKAGFYEIPLREMREGDAFIASIGSKTANHGGIYLGNGLILHHTTSSNNGFDPTRLSNRTPAERYVKFFRKALRHADYQA